MEANPLTCGPVVLSMRRPFVKGVRRRALVLDRWQPLVLPDQGRPCWWLHFGARQPSRHPFPRADFKPVLERDAVAATLAPDVVRRERRMAADDNRQSA